MKLQVWVFIWAITQRYLVNLGAHVLDALFKEWVKGHAEIHRRKEETKEGELATLGPHESEDNRKVNFTTTEWEEQKKEKKRAKIQKKERERVKEKTRPFFFPPNTQITISEVNTKSDISRGLYSKTVAEFSGKEKIPKWVFQALLHNMFRCRVSPKVVFSITSTGPDLALIKKKFTAIRLLPVSRYISLYSCLQGWRLSFSWPSFSCNQFLFVFGLIAYFYAEL